MLACILRLWLFRIVLPSTAVIATAATNLPFVWEMPPGWAETRGGAGGKILRVTTLKGSGPGSLTEALSAEGPRIVEFAVAGSIDLGGREPTITQPYLTLAGETAPSPGVTLVNGGLDVQTHDVIVRHLRVRPTDGNVTQKNDTLLDCFRTGRGAYDVIVDHCSFAWGTNKNLGVSGPRFDGDTPDDWRKNTSHRITFSHCLVAENLHPADLDSKATLIHDNVTQIAIIGNLYVSNDDRHPLFKGGASGAAVNNYLYNPGMRVMQFGFVPDQWQGHEWQRAFLTMVGNVARKGPSSVADLAMFEIWPTYAPCDFYLHDNLMLDVEGAPLSSAPKFRNKEGRLVPAESVGGTRQVDVPPLWPPGLNARPASEVVAWVLANVGARPWDRDVTDQRLVKEARDGGGSTRHFPGSRSTHPPQE